MQKNNKGIKKCCGLWGKHRIIVQWMKKKKNILFGCNFENDSKEMDVPYLDGNL